MRSDRTDGSTASATLLNVQSVTCRLLNGEILAVCIGQKGLTAIALTAAVVIGLSVPERSPRGRPTP
jgi:hypothetical protein